MNKTNLSSQQTHCPLCAFALEDGFIQSGQEIIWTKKLRCLHVVGRQTNNQRIIAPMSFIKSPHAPALYCPNCHIVITSAADFDNAA